MAILPDGTGSVTRIIGGGTDNIPAGNIAIAGNSFTATFPTSFLPGFGLAPSSYTWNLWPRVGLGQNVQVADFAPDNSNAAVVPEPAALGLMALVMPMLRRPQISSARSRC